MRMPCAQYRGCSGRGFWHKRAAMQRPNNLSGSGLFNPHWRAMLSATSGKAETVSLVNSEAQDAGLHVDRRWILSYGGDKRHPS